MREVDQELEAYYVVNRSRILAFIRSKVSDDALAEDILQDSLVSALRSSPDVDDSEGLVSWLYRIIRNAITDAHRRQGSTQRKLAGYALALPDTAMPPDDERALCACFVDLLPGLRPEYAEVLEAMDLGTVSTEEMSSRLGITANNLKVRRHRARRQLRELLEATCRTCAEHGCLDCTCSP